MKLPEKAYRPSDVPLSLLAKSEVWVLPHGHRSATHPLIIAFYVPAHLARYVPGAEQPVPAACAERG